MTHTDRYLFGLFHNLAVDKLGVKQTGFDVKNYADHDQWRVLPAEETILRQQCFSALQPLKTYFYFVGSEAINEVIGS